MRAPPGRRPVTKPNTGHNWNRRLSGRQRAQVILPARRARPGPVRRAAADTPRCPPPAPALTLHARGMQGAQRQNTLCARQCTSSTRMRAPGAAPGARPQGRRARGVLRGTEMESALWPGLGRLATARPARADEFIATADGEGRDAVLAAPGMGAQIFFRVTVAIYIYIYIYSAIMRALSSRLPTGLRPNPPRCEAVVV